MHSGYVDCVRWLGEYVMSKSVDNRILIWKSPGPGPQDADMRATGHIHYVQARPLNAMHIECDASHILPIARDT